MKRYIVGCVIVIAAMAAPPVAGASTGHVTRAIANASWTLGSFGGTLKWSGCRPKDSALELIYCGWIPFATVGPGSDPSDCGGPGRDDPDRPGSGVVVIWRGETQTRAGVSAFDLPDVSLGGTAAPLFCLTAIELRHERPRCEPAVACPMYVAVSNDLEVLSSAKVSAEEPSELSGPPLLNDPAPGSSEQSWPAGTVESSGLAPLPTPTLTRPKSKLKKQRGRGRKDRSSRPESIQRHQPVSKS